mmetsp:Transcript_153467/g.372669  ORF Transcript_153467/g.372669 Transcript_153467/m.372669 type:complete len:110 (-) Transcript_153467:136-465(-)
MKVLFAVAALAIIGAAAASCDADALQTCANTYTTCATDAGTDMDAACECYGTYVGCYGSSGCAEGTAWTTVEDACKAACPDTNCSGAGSVTMSLFVWAFVAVVAFFARF